MCAALPAAEAPCSSPAALYEDISAAVFGAAATSVGADGASVRSASRPPAILEAVAEMAAGWTQLLASPASGPAAAFALAGIAASVLVAACPRWEHKPLTFP